MKPAAAQKPVLSLERGWLLVLIWLLTTSIIWLLAAIAPGISGWMNSNQHLSGWAQALGGFLAIVGAWMLGRMQINAALAAERERERTTRLRHIQAAYLCFSDVLEDLRCIGDINTLASGAPQEVVRLSRECAADLERLVIHELPAYLASPASNCKGMLRTFAAAIERLESFTAKEHGYIQSDAARIRRAAWRGQSLAWAGPWENDDRGGNGRGKKMARRYRGA